MMFHCLHKLRTLSVPKSLAKIISQHPHFTWRLKIGVFVLDVEHEEKKHILVGGFSPSEKY